MNTKVDRKKVVVQIVEQPMLVDRFRYKSEGRKVRSSNSASGKFEKTYPAIRILNYTGPATVVTSCVTAEKPYRQHPNTLVGDNCRKGVCTIAFKTDELNPTVITLKNIVIQCSKKDEMRKVLTERQQCNVDPFRAGFDHKNDRTFKTPIRLCFQVILGSVKSGTKLIPVYPVVSEIIRSKDSLEIFDISDATSPTSGRKKIVIFCSKVMKGDIKLRFYRPASNQAAEWEAWVHKPTNIHRQVAISFETPPYITNDITEPVDVLLELVRPSDGKRSEPPYRFQYVANSSNIANLMKKKEPKIARSEVFFHYIEQWHDEQRKYAQMNITNPPINSNTPTINPNPNTAARPSGTQSNFIPNLSHHGDASINPTVQSSQNHQTHFDDRSLPNHQTHQFDNQTVLHNPIHPGAPSVYNLPCQPREPTPMNYSQPQTNQPYHDPQQRSQFHLQPPSIQPVNNVQLQSHGSPLQEQPVYTELQPMRLNPGYGGKNLSSATPYNPFPNYFYYNADQNPVSSNMQQYDPTNDIPTTINHHDQQNRFENNFIYGATNIENVDGAYGYY